MTATPGRYLVELMLTGGDSTRKTVPAFWLETVRDTVDDSAVEASDEFTALSAALSQISGLSGISNRLDADESDIATLQTSVTAKANTTDVNSALALKANTTDVNSALALKANTTDVNSALAAYWKTIYPVGAVYISAVSTSPATLFGGTWTRVKDTFLLAVGNTYGTVLATGGEAAHTLTVAELPSHRHGASEGQFHAYTSTGGADTVGSGTNFNSIQYTAYTGGGGRHNNMPPYTTFYMWRRTA